VNSAKTIKSELGLSHDLFYRIQRQGKELTGGPGGMLPSTLLNVLGELESRSIMQNQRMELAIFQREKSAVVWTLFRVLVFEGKNEVLKYVAEI